MKRGQVHRFRDSVAAFIGEGETVYMTPDEARAMANALSRAARSVEQERFTDSSGLTTPLLFSGHGATLERRPSGAAIKPGGLGRDSARQMLAYSGIELGADFHALSSTQIGLLETWADLRRYRKPKNANGSRLRYFHAYVQRKAA